MHPQSLTPSGPSDSDLAAGKRRRWSPTGMEHGTFTFLPTFSQPGSSPPSSVLTNHGSEGTRFHLSHTQPTHTRAHNSLLPSSDTTQGYLHREEIGLSLFIRQIS